MRYAPFFPMIAAVGLFSGCSDAPDLVQIQGRVTRGGQPLPGVILRFVPEEGRPSMGRSDQEGKFKLSYSKNYEGARLGKHRVFVVFDNTPATPYDESGRQRLNADQQAVIEKYGKLETSPLEVEIQEEGQQVEIKLD
jgi:hypothetical protein